MAELPSDVDDLFRPIPSDGRSMRNSNAGRPSPRNADDPPMTSRSKLAHVLHTPRPQAAGRPFGVPIEELRSRAFCRSRPDPSSGTCWTVGRERSASPLRTRKRPDANGHVSLISTTTTDAGQIHVDPVGHRDLHPAVGSPPQDSFYLLGLGQDGKPRPPGVDPDLASIAADPSPIEEVEGQTTIGLTILNLPGPVRDDGASPAITLEPRGRPRTARARSVSMTPAPAYLHATSPTPTGEWSASRSPTDQHNNSSVQFHRPNRRPTVASDTLGPTATIPSTTVPN